MTNIYFNLEEYDAVTAAPSDTLAAAKCLALFAQRLRRDMQEGDLLAKYFAEALEQTVQVPSSKQATTLTNALHLSGGWERAPWLKFGDAVARLTGSGKTEPSAITAAALEFGIDKKTANTLWSKYVEAKAAHQNESQ